MSIEAREPSTAFDFGQAAGAWFKTSGGKEYALRLWFWHSAAFFILLLIIMPMLAPHLGDMIEASWAMNRETFSGRQADPTAMLAVMGNMVIPFTLYMVGFLIVTCMGESALYRKYLLGAEPARIPIRVDKHTGRNLLAILGFYVLYMAIYIIGVFGVALIAGIFGVIFGPLGAILAGIGILLLIAIMFAFPVRMAPAAALSGLKGKTHVLAARHITKNRFWSLFGVYLVVWIGGYIGVYITNTIAMLLISGDPEFMIAMSGLSKENPRAIFDFVAERFSNPLFMLLGIFSMAMIAASYSAWMLWIAGVSAYAVRLWQSDDPTIAFK